jgi:preprotein translocase subunit SecG
MQTVLIAIHLIAVLALIAVVLLQRSEGGALGIGGGGFMTGRGQANALTRATAVLAAIFFATSLALTILANMSRPPSSILDQAAPGQSNSSGSLLDQLKQIDQQRQQQAPAPGAPAPAAPAAPAAPEPPRQ